MYVHILRLFFSELWGLVFAIYASSQLFIPMSRGYHALERELYNNNNHHNIRLHRAVCVAAVIVHHGHMNPHRVQ